MTIRIEASRPGTRAAVWRWNAFVGGWVFLTLVGCGNGARDERDLDGPGLPTSPSTPMTDDSTGAAMDDGGDERLDVAAGSDTGPMGGDCPGGMGSPDGTVDFSYAWIANSPEGTVSKIDTQSGMEVGRYATGPATQAEPSRTSVNLHGDVAVSNRGSTEGGAGGVTKIAARLEDCTDHNGDGEIRTSQGPTDVLAWGADECVQWNLEIDSAGYPHGPRPTAWEGAIDAQGCGAPNPRLWVAWYDHPANEGVFHRVAGDSGQVQDTIRIPWNGLQFGPYGGAVNAEGDLWAIGWQRGPLVRIDAETLAVERIEAPPNPGDPLWTYGISLDRYGNPWVASSGSAAMYDITSQQWQFVNLGNQSMRGVMVDDEDRAWFAVDIDSSLVGCGLGVVDVLSRSVLAPAIALPGCVSPVGVSIDVDGFVWVVDQGADRAFKVDPTSYQTVLTVEGLASPYTYSDMTGAGLNLVVTPPTG